MKTHIIKIVASALFMSLLLYSCSKKDNQTGQPNDPKSLLTAHTWQVAQVETVMDGQAPDVIYNKDAPNNDEDFSKVRQTYKPDGTVVWVDETGASGTNGHYELLNDNEQIRLAYAGIEVVGTNLRITAATFSYQLPVQGGYMQINFTPIQ